MPNVDYIHAQGMHTLQGPQVALPIILEATHAKSVLDIGCGTGFWLKAALDAGLTDVFGLDGVPIDPKELLIPGSLFKVQDFTAPFFLGRKYDLVLCLEVAEHLPEKYASTLIKSLTAHSDTIVFSAACPDQEGQNHLNCQWPTYWQKLFNDCGFACFDELRDLIWQDDRIEPWYRQNIFIARRADKIAAGEEPRLKSMVHPEIIGGIVNTNFNGHAATIRDGAMPLRWYLALPFTALKGRLRKMRR